MRLTLLALLPLALTACAETGGGTSGVSEGGYITELPEGVLALVAPYQYLSEVKLDESGCYVYRYAGPVETTFLPLRSTAGRPICTRPAA